MYRKSFFLSILLSILVLQANGQKWSLTGRLFDDQAEPLSSGTVVLLNPADSTMEFFGITNAEGQFVIRNIKEGQYVLQASFIGFHTFYNPITLPRTLGTDVGDILMRPLPVDLEGAEVVGEAVPLQISGLWSSKGTK